MRYIKITFAEDGATDSMAFEAANDNDAFAQLTELCGPIPRSPCKFTEISEAEYNEMTGFEE